MVEGADGKISQPDGEIPQSGGKIPQLDTKPARKVAKTLLEQNNPAANLQEGPLPVSDDVLDAPRKLKKIARTMLELDIELAANEALLHSNIDNPEPPNSDPISPKPNPAGSGRYVAKTMLDHSMLFQAVSKSAVKMEQKAAQVAKERANEPVEIIEPIVADRKATKCQWSWTEPFNGKERYRACSVCQAGVYDFEGLERAQAEAIVFKRENLRKPKFYERGDGKFMTRDCPKQVARKVQLITLSALAVVTVVSVIIVMMLIPPTPVVQRAVEPAEKADRQTTSSAKETTTPEITAPEGSAAETTAREATPPKTTTAVPAMSHYENGKITRPSAPASQQQSDSAKPESSAVLGGNDQMWDSSGAASSSSASVH